MIGNRPVTGKGFAGLQNYLLHGRNGASPDRSLWTSTRNLEINDPEQAALVMRATANQAARGTETPVYHLSVSLAPGETLDRATLEGVADRLLRDLGLEQHQVLVAEHGDGAQQHIHLMVNRVNPETRTVWKPWRDWYRIESSLRSQELELGLRSVPGRLAEIPGRERFVGTRLSQQPFAQRVRGIAGEGFEKAKTWQELHASLSRRGLRLQPSRSGRGLVVTDGHRFAAASKVVRDASRPRLERRLGPFERASPDLRKVQEISRAFQQRGRLEAMRLRFRRAALDLSGALKEHERARSFLARSTGHLDAVLDRTYRDPGAARARIERSLEKRGWVTTAEKLRERPATFGKLRGRLASRERGEARRAARDQMIPALGSHVDARSAERHSLQRLESFRCNPSRSLVRAAGRAQQVLARGLERLDRIESNYPSRDLLRAQAVSVVRRLGWRAVSHLVPHAAYQALRVTVSLAKTPARILGQDLGRGIGR